MTPYKLFPTQFEGGSNPGDAVSGGDVADYTGHELHYKPNGALDPLGFYDKNAWARQGFINPMSTLGNVLGHRTDGTANTGANADVDITGQDSDVYGSTDASGFDQASWSLEQQWKLDEAERQFNSAEAAKQRDWEKMMSDTAISRAVADIKAAGLNPWLALNGGSLGAASTPSGASASASSGSSKTPVNYLIAMLSGLISSASKIIAAAI